MLDACRVAIHLVNRTAKVIKRLRGISQIADYLVLRQARPAARLPAE
jgi:hypothetical protein